MGRIVEYDGRFFFLNALAHAFFEVDRCFGRFGLCLRQWGLRGELRRVDVVITRQTGGVVLNGGAV